MKHRKVIALVVSLTLVSCFFVVPVSARQSPVDVIQTNLNAEQPNLVVSAATRLVRTKAVRRVVRNIFFEQAAEGAIQGDGRQSQLILPAEVLD